MVDPSSLNQKKHETAKLKCPLSSASEPQESQHDYSTSVCMHNVSTNKTAAERPANTHTAIETKDAKDEYDRKYKELLGATRLSVAPMMEYTNRHFRHLVRLLSKRTLLYTEMVGVQTICNDRLLADQQYRHAHPLASDKEVRDNFPDQYLRGYLQQGRAALEGPSVLQLGGSDPQRMYDAARTIMDLTARGACDYTAINLNCGCPSKVSGEGCFGAALMDDPELVARLTTNLYEGCGRRMPITVKCRIGTRTDSEDQPFATSSYDNSFDAEYAKLSHFIEIVASNGIVKHFAVHARIAVMAASFSTGDNRKIPPLKYEIVRRLVQDFPTLTFTLNGGIESISQLHREFQICPNLKGVMVGRVWVADPWSFAMVDRLVYHDTAASSCSMNRLEILQKFGTHADLEEEAIDPINVRRYITRAVTPLFAGEVNGKRFRLALKEIAELPRKLQRQGRTLEGQPPISELILNAALDLISEEVLLQTPERSYELNLNRQQNRRDGRTETVAEWQDRRRKDVLPISASKR